MLSNLEMIGWKNSEDSQNFWWGCRPNLIVKFFYIQLFQIGLDKLLYVTCASFMDFFLHFGHYHLLLIV